MTNDEKIGAATPKWSYPEHILSLQPSVIREILKLTSKPEIISFAGGLPDPSLFPLDEIAESTKNALQEYKGAAVQYTLTRGITPLRELLAKRISDRGAATEVANLLVTSGAQQAVDMVTRVLTEPGDTVLTENPTYVGALQIFDYRQIKVVSAEMDENGIITDQVEEQIIKHQPKLIYTVSTFQNPTGISMSEERRIKLIELGRKYGIPIVDDTPYNELRFTGQNIPTLKALGGDDVITIHTVAKILAPGLRLGWINASKEFINVIEKIKQSDDLHAGTLNQYICHDFCKRGLLEPHIEKIKEHYGAKRNLMLAEIEKQFPDGIKWTRPDGGLFLWVELPQHLSAKELLERALKKNVAFVYGQPFYPDGSVTNTFRLNFATATHERIVEGISRLGSLLNEVI